MGEQQIELLLLLLHAITLLGDMGCRMSSINSAGLPRKQQEEASAAAVAVPFLQVTVGSC